MTNPSPRCTVFLTLAAVFTTWICEKCFAQNSNVVPDRAVAWRQNALNRTPGSKFLSKVEEVKKLLSDAEGYYSSGRYDLAFKKYERVLNLDPYNVAAVYEGLGDVDQGIEWLRRAVRQRSSAISGLRVDPFLDGLRADPRFPLLLKQVRLSN